ncbi:hypothetical protein TL16_g12839 [Triparma laevis f. inornata]|uniref:Kinesin light chain n=2 Tax=Triparma laevis TaxID=1534972 RepID=A0A9W7B1I7_9STRA|nr:hypothetical protein TrLO_g3592 [Triparma laevis f. longispina]GMH94205.1 hypothetical protein TL16_g12839 [Triparma laevis f. inornata]
MAEHDWRARAMADVVEEIERARERRGLRKQFDGNEEAYLRWKEVFDVLEIGNARDVGPDLPLEQQVLMITKSEDLLKLRALAKLCSTGLNKKNDPRNLEILDACAALGAAGNWVEDFDDLIRYYKRVKEGYEEQLGHGDTKTLDVTRSLIYNASGARTEGERIEKFRDLLKRCERALGEENVVTLDTFSSLDNRMKENGQFEEAKEVHEKCLAGRMKVLGEDHKDMLDMVHNLGAAYVELKSYENALGY